MDLFDVLFARKQAGGSGGGSGGSGGGSDYDGLLCYDVANYIEMMEDFPLGIPMVKVSNACPDLTGKECISAGNMNENTEADIAKIGEVTVLDETDEDGNHVMIYMVPNTDGTPFCVAVPEETSQLTGVPAGVWVDFRFSILLMSYIIFK
jgi:hypothetical protein